MARHRQLDERSFDNAHTEPHHKATPTGMPEHDARIRMGHVSWVGKNDHHALTAIARGTLTADQDTGHCSINGRIVGHARPNGHIAISVPRISGRGHVTITAHRIVWMVHHAAIPVGMLVKHRNGMTWDNRLGNLELAATPNSDIDPGWWDDVEELITSGAPYDQVAALTPSTEPTPTVYTRRALDHPVYNPGR